MHKCVEQQKCQYNILLCGIYKSIYLQFNEYYTLKNSKHPLGFKRQRYKDAFSPNTNVCYTSMYITLECESFAQTQNSKDASSKSLHGFFCFYIVPLEECASSVVEWTKLDVWRNRSRLQDMSWFWAKVNLTKPAQISSRLIHSVNYVCVVGKSVQLWYHGRPFCLS